MVVSLMNIDLASADDIESTLEQWVNPTENVRQHHILVLILFDLQCTWQDFYPMFLTSIFVDLFS